MTTFALGQRPSLGHSSISRRYAVSLTDFGPHLLDRLLSIFRLPITYAPYTDSINSLFAEVRGALEGEDLPLEAKERLFSTVQPAIELLLARPLGLPEPAVDVWPDGRIGFEWYIRNGRIVDATIDASRRLVYSALIGQARRGGVIFVDNEWPRALVDAIHEVRQ